MASAAAVVWVTALVPSVPQVREEAARGRGRNDGWVFVRNYCCLGHLPFYTHIVFCQYAPLLSPCAGRGCGPPGRRAAPQPSAGDSRRHHPMGAIIAPHGSRTSVNVGGNHRRHGDSNGGQPSAGGGGGCGGGRAEGEVGHWAGFGAAACVAHRPGVRAQGSGHGAATVGTVRAAAAERGTRRGGRWVEEGGGRGGGGRVISSVHQ